MAQVPAKSSTSDRHPDMAKFTSIADAMRAFLGARFFCQSHFISFQ
jgi:hypothetical protein